MMKTVFRHEFLQNRKSLLIWTAIVSGMSVMMILLYPSVKDQMQEMAESYANMAGFSAAFGLDKINIGDLMGFYGIEAGAILSLAGAMFAALMGSSILSKEEGMHTSEFLFSHPITRSRVMGGKLLFIGWQLLLFNVICFLVVLLSVDLIQEAYDLKLLLLFHTAQTIMHLQIAGICYGISAFTKKSNIGVGLGFAALLYFLNIFVNVTEDMAFLKYITPFHYADAATIFSNEQLDISLIGIGITISIVMVIAGFRKFQTKDLSA